MPRNLESTDRIIAKLATLTGVDQDRISDVLWFFGQAQVGVPRERRVGGAIPQVLSRKWGPQEATHILERIASNDDAVDAVLEFAADDHGATENPRLLAFNKLSPAEKRNSAPSNIMQVIQSLNKQEPPV